MNVITTYHKIKWKKHENGEKRSRDEKRENIRIEKRLKRIVRESTCTYYLNECHYSIQQICTDENLKLKKSKDPYRFWRSIELVNILLENEYISHWFLRSTCPKLYLMRILGLYIFLEKINTKNTRQVLLY